VQRMVDDRLDARRYTREYGEDDPTIANWAWDHEFQAASLTGN
jgi:xylulose-5-phosphate/fructose-6-phosphate phosphoketolase